MKKRKEATKQAAQKKKDVSEKARVKKEHATKDKAE